MTFDIYAILIRQCIHPKLSNVSMKSGFESYLNLECFKMFFVYLKIAFDRDEKDKI